MVKRRKTKANLEKDLASARRSAKAAQGRLKAYKEGLKEGLAIRRD